MKEVKKTTLEEAADEYEKNHTYQRYDGGGFTPEYNATLAEAFQAGAKWMAEQCDEETSKAIGVLRQTFYIDGWDDCKERMPKWKKSPGVLRYGILEDEHGRYIQHDGYKLYFDDLLKLPKVD